MTIKKRKNILITGASGFLGKTFTEYFCGQYNLFLPSHKDLDLLDRSVVEKYLSQNKIDVIVHCAAVGVGRKDNTSEAFMQNLIMFVNLARCSRMFERMIFIGSGAEYDKRRDIIKIKEDEFGICVPADPYGFYKYICSLLILNFSNIVNLRSFAVFGKYEDYETRFISNTICKSMFNLPVVINQDVRFDYFSSKDLAIITEYFINNKPQYQFYNIGSGCTITLTEIVKKIEKFSGRKIKITIKESGFNKEYTCDNSRILNEISGLSFLNFDEAVSDLYNWYVSQKEQIDKNKLSFDK